MSHFIKNSLVVKSALTMKFRVHLQMDKKLQSKDFQGVLDKDRMNSRMK